jgi:group I intron endonuclease
MNGSIYKCYKNDDKDIFYIGSTKNLDKRIISHRNDVRNKNTFFYKYVRDNGGFDNFIFEIYEELTDCTTDELLRREKEIINLLNPYLNTDKTLYRKEICMKAREAKALIAEKKKQEKLANPTPKGRPPKTSNEKSNEKSTQTEFISLTDDEIIKLRKIMYLIQF